MVETTWIIQATVPANQAANSVIPASIIVDPQKGPEATFTVPKGSMVVIKDLYVKSTPPVDGLLVITRNEFEEVLRTDVVSSLVVTNPAKPKYKPLVFTEGDRIAFKYINVEAETSGSQQTVTIYAKVEILPARGGGAPSQPASVGGIAEQIRRALGL